MEGNVYLAQDDGVFIYDLKGRFIRRWKKEREES